MSLWVFDKAEASYLDWIKNNPDAFVLNTSRSKQSPYLMLHKAHCGHIKSVEGSFTENQYFKVCSQYPVNIYAWALDNVPSADVKICKSCLQDPIITKQINECSFLEVELARLADQPNSVLEKIMDEEATAPGCGTRNSKYFRRKAAVIQYVRNRANGFCERCKNEAPFKKASNGEPYLEVHHIQALSAGGKDIHQNCIALCPNCHKFLHFGNPAE